MATVKISELPAATTPLTGDELVPIVQGGVTKQTPMSSTLSLTFILQSSVNVVRLLADGSFSPSAITFSAFQDNGVGVRLNYSGRFVIATSTDGVVYATTYTSLSDENSKTYTVPAGVTFVRCQLYKAGGFSSLIQQVVISVIRDGTDGSSGSGTDAVVVNLSKAAATVFAYADGSVPSFADIDGQVTVFKGAANQTATASFAVAGSGLTGEINTADNTPVAGKPKGYFRVTAMSADIGSLVITTSFESVDYVRSFSVSKVRTGYEIVGSLPVTNLFEGRLVFLTTDNKLYRYTGTEWTAAVPATDVTGQLTSSQIADLAAAKLTGTIVGTQIADDAITTPKLATGSVSTAKLVAFAVTANEIATDAITAAKIKAGEVIAGKLATNSVVADNIQTGAVTAAKIDVTELSAMTANTGNLSVNGTLTLGSSGKIITTGTTYDTNGVFLGEDGPGVYKFSVGGASGRLAFDGTNLFLPGGRLVNGSVAEAAIADDAITAGKISVSSLSAISADFGNMTAGAIDLTAGSYVVRHGAGFGASSDLVLWYGLSSVARGSATKTNGLFALATDGKVYLGSATLENLTTPMTATMTTDYSTTHSTNVTPTIDVSPAVSSITNGTSPYTYQWALVNMEEGSAPTITNANTAQCNIYNGATLSAALNYVGTVSCTITDANGKQLVKFFNFADYSTL